MKYVLKKLVPAVICINLLLPAAVFSQFRVVGYVPANIYFAAVVNDSIVKKLTHLNIAFVNPDSLGHMVLPAGFDSLILQARNNHVKVLMSIGGGGRFNPFLAGLLQKNNLPSFVDTLLQLVTIHRLDGIDIDLENDAIDSNYESFIIGLAAKLAPARKLLTAAFSAWNAQLISNTALNKFDFISIMSYDETGPWRPTEPGPHAPYEKAVADLGYWSTKRGVPKKKLNLGLPFYGYCFGTRQYGESMSYANIVTTFPGSEEKDMLVTDSGGVIYYNGMATIKSKTSLALKKSGGVMIWQVLQDAPGDKSLLTAIQQVMQKPVVNHK